MRMALTHGAGRTAATLGLVTALVCSTAAQQAPDELGTPSFPGWTFIPGASIAALWDSNVALDDAPASTGTVESDRIFQIRPSGQLEYVSPRTSFSTGYSGNLRRYIEFSELNGFDQRLNVSVRHMQTRRLTWSAANNFSDVPTTDEVDVNGVPFARTGTRTNSLSAGFAFRLTKFTDVAARYENTWVTFDPTNDETFLAGGHVHAFSADANRRLSERLTAGAQYAIRFANLNENTRQLTFQDAGGSVRYQLGPNTSLALAGGLSFLRDRTLGDSKSGPYVRTGITHDFPRATIGGAFERNYVPSFGFGGSTSSQELTGFVRMPIYQNRLYVQSSATWRRSIPLLEESLELDTLRLRTTAGYFATRWLRTETFYNYARQDSVVTGGEIDRHRVGVQLVVSQPMRIR